MSFLDPFAFQARSFRGKKFVTPCSLPTSIPQCFPLTCNLCYAFEHNSDSCLQYVRLRTEIKSSVETTISSMEHMIGNIFNQFSELVQTHNEWNFNEEEHIFEDTPLKASCKEVIVEVPSASLELVGPISHDSLESVFTLFTCSPPSLPFYYSVVKPNDDWMITGLNNDLGPENMGIEWLKERVNEFDRYLGTYGGYNLLIGPYYFHLEDILMSVVMPSLLDRAASTRWCYSKSGSSPTRTRLTY